MMLFEYMIGNTDYSIWAFAQRADRAGSRTARSIAVPYDFDLSGLVHAPYASPDPRLGDPQRDSIGSTAARAARIDEFDEAAAAFRAKRADMFALLDSMRDLEPARARRSEGLPGGVLQSDRAAGRRSSGSSSTAARRNQR